MDKKQRKKLLKKYEEVPIEEIPETKEIKEKIKNLREYGLGITVYEEYINFLKKYNRTPRQGIRRNGRTLGKDEITEEQRYEKSLHYRWKKSKIREISDIYSGQSIELVPVEFRKKISELREFGIGSCGLVGKNKQEKIKDRMRKSVRKYVGENDNIRRELEKDTVNEKFR